MLKARNITKKYGKKTILKDISLDAMPGTCTGIVGINGSGKSTLFGILSGTIKPDSGSLVCFNKDMLAHTELFPDMIGYVPQDDPLIEELTIKDNLRLWSKRNIDKLQDIVSDMELSDIINMPISKLSGGMRRRVSISCAIANKERILILDEPTSSLDIYHKANIHNFMKDFVAKNGIIIMSTHDIEEMKMCDRLYLLEDGYLKEDNTNIDDIIFDDIIMRLKKGKGNCHERREYK